MLFYLATYALATIGTFAALAYLGSRERPIETLDDLAGLGWKYPIVGLSMGIFMFSLAGIKRRTARAMDSGPLEAEITWEEVGQPTEFTTVTKKPRRVGAWDPDLAQAALRDNGAPKVNAVFTFADYLEPMLSGATERSDAVDEFVRYVEESLLQHPVRWIGTGPQTGVWMEDAE